MVNLFYLFELNCILINILLHLNYVAKTTYRTDKPLNIGDKVCVQSTLNSVMFCRALITNKFKDEYNVFYVDYGNTELVTSEDIFELSQELKEV